MRCRTPRHIPIPCLLSTVRASGAWVLRAQVQVQVLRAQMQVQVLRALELELELEEEADHIQA